MKAGKCSKCGGENDSGKHNYCKECNANYAREWRLKNESKIHAYRKATKKQRAKVQKEYDAKRPKRETKLATELTRKWRQKNPAAHNARVMARECEKLQAMPAWAIKFYIDEAYHLSRLRSESTDVKHHVDHIVPLRNKKVCGLHAHTNLQVIPAKENMLKGNQLIKTYKPRVYATQLLPVV